MTRQERTLAVAQQVAQLLAQHGIESAVIGAMALAIHHYYRRTDDFDLGTAADPFSQLPAIARVLMTQGFDVELRTPDADDPLGGVIDIRGDDFDMVQIVNFLNPYSDAGAVGREAIETAGNIEGLPLRVVDLPHLIALKLYAGGSRSKADAVELMERNRDLDLASVRDVCARFGLAGELEPLLRELGLS